jgi:hypothetical protein
MQLFVLKSDLSTPPAETIIWGIHDDLPLLDRGLYGAQYTPLSLPGSVVQTDQTTLRPYLKSDWRSNVATIANGESYRRIIECFTEFMQRNANSVITGYISQYGADSTTWPVDAKNNKAESDRGWAYVSLVRQSSDAMQSALPADPTDDSHWPTKITPVYIPS